MKERGILFSAPMVRAILAGQKTQTRRVVREGSSKTTRIFWMTDEATVPRGRYTGWVRECDAPFRLPLRCPYGEIGDQLWVRETWGLLDTQPSDGPERAQVFYRATDGERTDLRHQLWRPSIHMPRWASRITLKLKAVRAQCVQNISDADIAAEGFTGYVGAMKLNGEDTTGFMSARSRFLGTWNAINGQRDRCSWGDNPWVWVLEFEQFPRSPTEAT